MKQSKTMELKKPVRVSLARQVLTAMESMIRSGKWKVGDRIPAEAELARAFSVSHNTIREALQSLIHMGMLEARPGDGTYVMASDRFAVAVSNRLKESELPQILEARLALEKEIARLAAVKRTDEDLKELENALKDCHGRVRQGIEDDMLFHAAVARATHNPVLSELYNVVIRHVQENLEKLLQEKQYDSGAMKLHDDLLAAIRNQEERLNSRFSFGRQFQNAVICRKARWQEKHREIKKNNSATATASFLPAIQEMNAPPMLTVSNSTIFTIMFSASSAS